MASLSNKSNRDKIFEDNSDPAKGIILVIPRVFPNVRWQRIQQVFIDLNWGFIERIDTIPIQGGKSKRAFIHFAPGRWNTRNPEVMEVLDALRNGHQFKVFYDDPWYWKVSISRARRLEEAPKPESRSRVVESANSGASKNNNNNKNAERKRRRKERANAAQKRLNKTRKQNAGRRKNKKTRRRRRTRRK